MDELIVVRGTATGTCPADHGVLTVAARVKHQSPAEAERSLAEQTAAVDAVLDSAAEVTSARRVEALSIRPNSYWHPESGRTLVDGYIGERSVRVTVDRERAGTLIRALYDAVPVDVSGPEWELAEDNPLYAQTRRAAAGNARQRAEQYAEGLGLSVGGVAYVSEPGLRAEPPGTMTMMSMAQDSEVAGAPTIDLGSAEIRISASVDVGFRIEPVG